MASSVLAFASARSSIDRSARSAAYYGLAATDLKRIKVEGLDRAEAAAAAGNAPVVLEFSKTVVNLLSAEHRAWQFAEGTALDVENNR